MSTQQALDPKVIAKITKMLNLARDGGATEGEANNAMAMAERLMLENNLSIAQVEMNGGAATEARLKQAQKGKANYRWQRWLMTAIAAANYAHVIEIIGKRRIGGRDAWRDITEGYELIGRPSNIAATNAMYDYLLQTVTRLRREYEAQPGHGSKEGALFIEGLSFRLAERVKERHSEMLEQQAREAREQSTRASHPSAAPTSNALVVVMTDYDQSERDLNNDIANGWEPGTTLANRQRVEAERLAAQRSREEKEARIQTLMAEHNIKYGVAWNMVHFNHTLAEAIAYEEEYTASQARIAKGQARRSSSRSYSSRGPGKSREDRLNERLYTGAAGDGRRKGDEVSLDKQVDGRSTKRLS